MKPCPYCGEHIPEDAQVCPYCDWDLTPVETDGHAPAPKASSAPVAAPTGPSGPSEPFAPPPVSVPPPVSMPETVAAPVYSATPEPAPVPEPFIPLVAESAPTDTPSAPTDTLPATDAIESAPTAAMSASTVVGSAPTVTVDANELAQLREEVQALKKQTAKWRGYWLVDGNIFQKGLSILGHLIIINLVLGCCWATFVFMLSLLGGGRR